jgi:hypothetical protein
MEHYAAPANRRKLKSVMNSTCPRHRVEFLASNMRHMAVFGAIGPRM